jgi:hypothetical protein
VGRLQQQQRGIAFAASMPFSSGVRPLFVMR